MRCLGVYDGIGDGSVASSNCMNIARERHNIAPVNFSSCTHASDSLKLEEEHSLQLAVESTCISDPTRYVNLPHLAATV